MKMTQEELLTHVYSRLEHVVSKDLWITMICKYLTTQQLNEMLDMNELTPRFFGDDWCQASEDGTHSEWLGEEDEPHA